METPLYVVFEGLDYSGKTYQANKVFSKWVKDKRTCVATKEPGSDLHRLSFLRETILMDLTLDDATVELLLQADRSEHTKRIKEGMDNGISFIADRSFYSGYAYYYACGHDLQILDEIMKLSIKVKPDAVIYMDICPLESDKRAIAANTSLTREEMKGTAFKHRVVKGYELAFEAYPPKVMLFVNGEDDMDKNTEKITEFMNTLTRGDS